MLFTGYVATSYDNSGKVRLLRLCFKLSKGPSPCMYKPEGSNSNKIVGPWPSYLVYIWLALKCNFFRLTSELCRPSFK